MAERAVLGQHLFWYTLRPVLGTILRIYGRLVVTGRESMPRSGPALLLANHVCFLDPFFIGAVSGRATHYMASAFWFDKPVLSTLLRWIGAFPKKKFARDRGAMLAVQELIDQGAVVGIFPEGRRSWDGRTLAVRPNIGRLIARLGVPVVYCRLLTAHHHNPRWSRYHRWAPVRLELSGPVTYPPDMPHDEIEADVQRRITIDVDAHPVGRHAVGWRLAHGLPVYLWACPACFALESLEADPSDGDRVRCPACRARWRLDLAQAMHPEPWEGREVEPLTVFQASDRIRAHFGDPPVADPGRAEGGGPVLEDPDGELVLLERGGGRQPLGGGRISLTPRRLSVAGPGGDEAWGADMGELLAASIEAGDVLQLRTAEQLVRVSLGGASPVKWQHFLAAYNGLAGRRP